MADTGFEKGGGARTFFKLTDFGLNFTFKKKVKFGWLVSHHVTDLDHTNLF